MHIAAPQPAFGFWVTEMQTSFPLHSHSLLLGMSSPLILQTTPQRVLPHRLPTLCACAHQCSLFLPVCVTECSDTAKCVATSECYHDTNLKLASNNSNSFRQLLTHSLAHSHIHPLTHPLCTQRDSWRCLMNPRMISSSLRCRSSTR